MNSILLALLLTATTPSFEVQTLDGQTFAGPLVELTADRLTIAAPEGQVSLDTAELLSISNQDKSAEERSLTGIIVTLTDGSAIIARQYTMSESIATITLPEGDVLKTPANTIDTVQLQQGSDALSAEWSHLTGQNVDSDLLVIQNGQNLNYHKGVLHDVTDELVRFDLDGELLPVKRSKVFGFAYRHGAEKELPPTVCRIKDSTGSQWSVRSIGLSTDLHWTTPTGLDITQAAQKIVQIDFSAGKIVYLSDLKPESIRWTPYFDAGKRPAAVEQFYAPRRDRSFESGPLQLGDTQYRKGLALYSRTKIVYRLPDRFRHFRAIAGIANAARPEGNVRLLIRGDDHVMLDIAVTGSDAPRPIDLDLSGVRRLTIVVDFGDHLGMGDYLLLCNARLTR